MRAGQIPHPDQAGNASHQRCPGSDSFKAPLYAVASRGVHAAFAPVLFTATPSEFSSRMLLEAKGQRFAKARRQRIQFPG